MYVREVYDYILYINEINIISCFVLKLMYVNLKKEYYKGRLVDEVLVFMGIEWDFKNCFFIIVENGELLIFKLIL